MVFEGGGFRLFLKKATIKPWKGGEYISSVLGEDDSKSDTGMGGGRFRLFTEDTILVRAVFRVNGLSRRVAFVCSGRSFERTLLFKFLANFEDCLGIKIEVVFVESTP